MKCILTAFHQDTMVGVFLEGSEGRGQEEKVLFQEKRIHKGKAYDEYDLFPLGTGENRN